MLFRSLEQTFQIVSGTARLGSTSGRLRGARLRGESLRFTLDAEGEAGGKRYEFEGRITGDAVAGRVKGMGGSEREWRASRVRRAAINIDPPRPDL